MLFSKVYSSSQTSRRLRLPFLKSCHAAKIFSIEIISLNIPSWNRILLRPPPQRNFEQVPVVLKLYETYRVLHGFILKFPKVQRYTLGQSLQDNCLRLLETVIMASQEEKSAVKIERLKQASGRLELLRLLVRLASDTDSLTQKQYLVLQTDLQEVGKMIGGWLKFIKE